MRPRAKAASKAVAPSAARATSMPSRTNASVSGMVRVRELSLADSVAPNRRGAVRLLLRGRETRELREHVTQVERRAELATDRHIVTVVLQRPRPVALAIRGD